MGAKTRNFFILAALIGLASYYFHTPVPDAYSTSDALEIRVSHAAMQLIELMGSAGELLGFGPKLSLIRSMLIQLGPAVEADDAAIQTHDAVFDGVAVRVYVPTEGGGQGEGGALRPGVVYYHGGGWVLFNIDSRDHDALVRKLCKTTNAVFVSVEYRLAPEFTFPAAHDDCVTATKHFLRHASDYNVDPSRVAIIGDSAGGNLAATVALRLRDDHFDPRPKLQVLIYPVVQIVDFQLPSMISNAHGPFLTRSLMADFAVAYIAGNSSLLAAFRRNEHISPVVRQRFSADFLSLDRLPKKYLIGYNRDALDYNGDDSEGGVWNQVKDRILSPYLCPLLAPDLAGLPQAYVVTCEYDVLRDEGLLYAYRLRAAGNGVTHFHAETGLHGMLTSWMDWKESGAVLDGIAGFIAERL